jgi:small subunit ribosomal protein S17
MKKRKTKIGIVVSDKMDKTVVVETYHIRKHPLYGKNIKIRRKYKAHNENNEASVEME